MLKIGVGGTGKMKKESLVIRKRKSLVVIRWSLSCQWGFEDGRQKTEDGRRETEERGCRAGGKESLLAQSR